MSVGYRQPPQGQGALDLTFEVSGDEQTNGLNFLAGLLDVATDPRNSGSWASLLVLAAQCRDKLTHVGDLTVCVATEAVGNLADPNKAVAAAHSVLGAGYGDAFRLQWTKVAKGLHARGSVVNLVPVRECVSD